MNSLDVAVEDFAGTFRVLGLAGSVSANNETM